MDAKKVVKELKVKYPDKKIVCDPEDYPTEIIVEIEPTSDHPKRSLALAVVGKSKPHYHKKSTEIYEAVFGKLTVYVEGKKYELKKGEKVKIKPGKVHCVVGEEAWFLTHSKPGWTLKDHILKEEK